MRLKEEILKYTTLEPMTVNELYELIRRESKQAIQGSVYRLFRTGELQKTNDKPAKFFVEKPELSPPPVVWENKRVVEASISWKEWFMGMADHSSKRSKDPTQVGAVLAGPHNDVRLCAYNGPPMGVRDYAERFERPTKYLYASHAEANLISFAAREGISTRGCTVYVTHQPCATCARLIIQSGITRVVYGNGETHMSAEEFAASEKMFAEAGVIYERYTA
jgi:dCMP deaminase